MLAFIFDKRKREASIQVSCCRTWPEILQRVLEPTEESASVWQVGGVWKVLESGNFISEAGQMRGVKTPGTEAGLLLLARYCLRLSFKSFANKGRNVLSVRPPLVLQILYQELCKENIFPRVPSQNLNVRGRKKCKKNRKRDISKQQAKPAGELAHLRIARGRWALSVF